MVKDNYIQASICYDCHELIVLRQLGNVWKLPKSIFPSHKDKKQHKPTVVLSNLWDARQIKKEANNQFWKDKKLCENVKPSYNKRRLEAINRACDVLGFVDSK